MSCDDSFLYNSIITHLCEQMGIPVQPLKQIVEVNDVDFHIRMLVALRGCARYRITIHNIEDAEKIMTIAKFAGTIFTSYYYDLLETKQKGLVSKVYNGAIDIEEEILKK